jgi:hypothetical protein
MAGVTPALFIVRSGPAMYLRLAQRGTGGQLVIWLESVDIFAG